MRSEVAMFPPRNFLKQFPILYYNHNHQMSTHSRSEPKPAGFSGRRGQPGGASREPKPRELSDIKAKYRLSEFRIGKLERPHEQSDIKDELSKTRCPQRTDPPAQIKSKSKDIGRSEQKSSLSRAKPSTKNTPKQLCLKQVKKLLPPFLYFRFPAESAHLICTVEAIDEYLISSTNKELVQSFPNLQLYLKNIKGLAVGENDLRRINFIYFGLYSFWVDPLRQLVVGFPKKQTQYLRLKNFKKLLFQRHERALAEDKPVELGELALKIGRTQRFYPKKRFPSPRGSTDKEQDSPLQDLKNLILREIGAKENLLKENTTGQADQLDEVELSALQQMILQIFDAKKVRSMYKVSLIELLGDKISFPAFKLPWYFNATHPRRLSLQQITINQRSIINLAGTGRAQGADNDAGP